MTEQIHVLYVDDEPDLLTIGKMFLEITGDFTVTTHESALSAVQLIQEGSFDAIISDYQMPRMDGIELLKSVRSAGYSLPFILFTGRGREEVVIQALNAGADFYLQKGGDPKAQFTELAHQIRLAVRQRRLETSIRDYERRESDILNFLPDATFAINTNRVVIAWNRAMERMTGVPASDILGKGNYEYALPFYHERRPLIADLVLQDDPTASAKYPFLNRDGVFLSSEITIPHFHEGKGASLWFTASPLYDNEGRIIGAIESIRDITESKEAQETLLRKHEELQGAYEEISATEEELRSNYFELAKKGEELERKELQLQAMADNVPGVLYRYHVNADGTTGLDFISKRSIGILGLDNDINQFFDRFVKGIVDKDRDRFLISVQHAVASRIPWNFDCQFEKPSGEKIWLNIVSSPVMDEDTLFFDGIVFDNTLYKETDEFTRFLAHVSDSSPASITVHDFDGNMLYANEKTFEIHGFTREEFLSKNLHDLDVPESEAMLSDRMDQVLKQGEMEFDVEHYHKDGRRIPLHVHVKIIEWDEKPVILSIATDRSERIRYEEILQKKNQELDLRMRLIDVILETVPIGIFMVEVPSGRPLISNPAAVRLLGRGILPDATEQNLSEVYEAYKLGTGEKYPTKEMPIIRGMYGESSHIDDMEVIHPDGTSVLLEVYGNPVTDGQGHIIASLVSFLDITDRKRIEQLLKESEESARALINAEKESIFMMKSDGTIMYANETMASRFGYTVEDILGKNAYDVAPPGLSEERRRHVEQVINTREPVHFHDERFGRIIENNLYPILDESGEVSRIAVYGRDITEKQESARQIAESEEKYRNVVERAHEGIIIVQGTRLVYANEAFARMSGYMPSEIEGLEYLDFIRDEDIPGMQELFVRITSENEKTAVHEVHLVKKDNTIFTVEVHAVDITYQGNPGFLFLVRDISERKRAEEIQKKTLNLLNEVQKLTHLGGWEYDVNSGHISWTEEVYQIHGVGHEHNPDDVARDLAFYTPEDAPIIEEAFIRSVREGVPYDLELKFVKADGRQIWVRTMGKPVIQEGRVVRITGNIMDITERKQLEVSLREAIQKLKMLTGITRHDVVNELSIITLSLEMLQDSEDEETRHHYLEKALDAVKILEKTIGFTQEYENFGSISSQWSNLLSIVTSSETDIDLAGIRVKISISPDIEIFSDPIIRKVFSTLFENAVRHGGDALSEIRIFTQEKETDLIIIFEDNGIGVAEEEKSLIFHHGYGHHTGIGLFLAEEILSITGFSIRESGVQGVGARFEILVPNGWFRYLT